MKKTIIKSVVLLILAISCMQIKAQVQSASDNMVAHPFSDRTLFYDVTDEGEALPITWGLDLAWLSESNIRRGIAFMGIDNVDIIRSSFMPTEPLVDGHLQGDALKNTLLRISIIKNNLGSNAGDVVLNSDHPTVHSYFYGNAVNWAALIDETRSLHEASGLNVVAVSPFNEPDYSATGQGNIEDFYNIAGELKNNANFDDIRISGGNTLNTDQASYWYNYLKSRLDEGNTHQLAGSFDNYAAFFQEVRVNGDHATNDELHNVMEAMVGVEYGMQTGIWWGTAELARGEFCKASNGVRLAYAEHRPNWTAASVYKGTDGRLQAFGGTSERQAATTTYRFVSTERDVYYDGHGPQREYLMTLPGGTGYQQGQTNAEQVVNITWGDDIQPVINGKYVLVNRNSGKVMEVANGSSSAGANLQQGTYTGATYQQWDVKPVDSRIGGDFSYYTLSAVHSAKVPDVLNWSLDKGTNIIVWDDAKGGNQQWYLDYVEDGWFYIRSRHSNLCLHVQGAGTANDANIIQWEPLGGSHQQWRFLPVGAAIEFDAPAAPANFKASANPESVRLSWTESPEDDVAGYTIFRADSARGAYETIARQITSTEFVDNTATMDGEYFYAVKAVDKSLNSSDYSEQVSATTTGSKALVAKYKFQNSTIDNSINLNHGASSGGLTYIEGKIDDTAISLDGDDDFIQLPATVANQKEITVATWVYWRAGALWQRIFDFGNGEDQYMYLTPVSGTGKLRFAIKDGGEEEGIHAPGFLPTKTWTHVAVTMSETETRLFLNGEIVAESDAITISPMDFKPALNYIGRSQFDADPTLKGDIDDFRIYNYALTREAVAQLATGITDAIKDSKTNQNLSVWPMPAKDVLFLYCENLKNESANVSVYNLKGKLLFSNDLSGNSKKLDVSSLPNGMYLLKFNTSQTCLSKKLIIKH